MIVVRSVKSSMIVLPTDTIVHNLKADEGYRAHAYQCGSGAWTVAYGRNIDQNHGGLGISQPEAEFLLRNDVDRCVDELRRTFGWVAEQPADVQVVLVELTFWLGLTRLRKFRKCLAALESGDRTTAAAELIDSRLYRQIPGRTKRLADRMRGADAD